MIIRVELNQNLALRDISENDPVIHFEACKRI